MVGETPTGPAALQQKICWGTEAIVLEVFVTDDTGLGGGVVGKGV